MSTHSSRRLKSPNIDYVYSHRRQVDVCSTTSSRNDSLTDNNSWCDYQRCASCNWCLENELECLRESTKNALHESWDEVELLNKKHAEQEERVVTFSAGLSDSLGRENKLKVALENAQKELAKLKRKRNNHSHNKGSSYLPRRLCDEFIRNAFPSTTKSSAYNYFMLCHHKKMLLWSHILNSYSNQRKNWLNGLI